jgi:hypothetical protein
MVCGGFLTVEQMRRGMKPTDACLATLKRVLAQTPARLLQPDGRPKFACTSTPSTSAENSEPLPCTPASTRRTTAVRGRFAIRPSCSRDRADAASPMRQCGLHRAYSSCVPQQPCMVKVPSRSD